jgi:hypothetical protein
MTLVKGGRPGRVTEGNDAETVARLADHVDDHTSDVSRIKEVCIDMSSTYIKGVTVTKLKSPSASHPARWSTTPSTRSAAPRARIAPN